MPDYLRLLEVLDSEDSPVMLYGSHARGDSGEDSDIDLLELALEQHGHFQLGAVSVTRYSAQQLRRMCESGSLFAFHLAVEGKILRDPEGELQAVLAAYRQPPSYDSLIAEAEIIAQLLDSDITLNPEGFARLALYLVRTVAIARQLQKTGHPVFSVPQLAEVLGRPELVLLFRGRELPENLNVDRVIAAKKTLRRLLGHSATNPFSSLEALAVNLEERHPTASKLALRLLSGERALGYGDILLDPIIPPND
jgi:predicted nucleotidyltransferase